MRPFDLPLPSLHGKSCVSAYYHFASAALNSCNEPCLGLGVEETFYCRTVTGNSAVDADSCAAKLCGGSACVKKSKFKILHGDGIGQIHCKTEDYVVHGVTGLITARQANAYCIESA
jgi:hypothetical protein